MYPYLGDFAAGSTIFIPFQTFNSSGASVTITGLAVTDIEVYKGASMTQRSSDAGYALVDTDGIDLDGVTGIHGFTIDTSDNTDSGFYAAGNDYTVVVSSITADSQTVNFIAARFSIENRVSNVTKWSGTAVATPDTAGYPKVTIKSGTGTGEVSLSAGLLAWNAAWDAEVQSEVEDGLIAQRLDHLVATSVTGTDVADDSIIAKLVSSAATADWDTYVNTTDALQAIRDRGDAAWTTGGGGSITDIIQWEPLIPAAIDLANTKTYRLGIAITNQLDDLPTTVEITPGTISIERAAQGGTAWTAVVTDAACSEIAGLIYYDEVFDTASTYAAGDVLRITFKNQVVTVAANDYEITGSTGRMFYTGIIAVNPDVNVALISGSSTAADVLELFALALDQGTGQIDSGTFQSNAITASSIQDGALTVAKFGGNVPANVLAISDDTVAADNLEAYTDGTTPMPVNATQISGDATAADNLEAALDGTGGVTIDAAIEIRSSGGSAGHNASDLVNSMLTTQMTEAYAADGAAPTVAQALLAIQQFLFDKDVSGTTLTVRRLDGTTSAMTFTLDSGTNPTDINRTG